MIIPEPYKNGDEVPLWHRVIIPLACIALAVLWVRGWM